MLTVKNTKFSVSLTIIFCALLVQFQTAHGQDVPPPDTTWDADPLDVLDKNKDAATVEPSVPEFTEIPDPEVHNVETPPPPAAPDVPAPDIPADVPAPQHADASPYMGNGEPDYDKESRFHSIYKKYNEQPTSDEAWEKAVGSRKSEVYKVQKGNTLWDISTTFFGDPNFWPKLWSLNNGAILNPHEITPDMNIQFFPGTMMDAPTLAVAGQEASAAAAADKVVEPSVAEPPVPASTRKFTPVLKDLPGSLPHGRFGVYDNSTGVEIQFRKNVFPTPFEFLSYYLSDSVVTGAGSITSTEMDTQTAGEYQYIYVTMNGTPEKNYIVQKNMGDMADPATKGRKAQMIEVQGSIEVMEKVNPAKNIYRALVKKAIQPLEVGAVLIPGELPMIDPTPGTVSDTAGAKIMGGQYGKNRGLFMANSLVFLDGGSGRGFQEGQNLSVYADEALRNRRTDAIINDRVIGSIKVIKVTANFATAYVTKSNEDILLGDYVGISQKTAKNDSAPAVESHSPESTEELEKELDMQGAPEVSPEAGSEDLDLEL
ncbi:LysM peptidoglycan-binding domain-containing protein [Bdellovibrio sp. HCB209]|uniref:LysM peptidoglycan-binding domain-containing protein n=1 Tax=Bdellovibrio sp. HCB209 TaxID=3394354 RepID=UPI0039B46E10